MMQAEELVEAVVEEVVGVLEVRVSLKVRKTAAAEVEMDKKIQRKTLKT